MKTSLVLFIVFLGCACHCAQAETIVAVTESNVLLTFDSEKPGEILSALPVTGLQAGEDVLGLDARPATGQLYALTRTRLYTIDPNTSAATLVASLVADPTDATAPFAALAGADFGIDFNPAVDRLRVVSNAGENLRINPNNGLVITDTPLAYGASDANVGKAPSIVEVAYTNNTPGSPTTLLGLESQLFSMKTLVDNSVVPSEVLVRIGGVNGTPSPGLGELTSLGPFARNGATLRGFDISPSGHAYVGVRIHDNPIAFALVTLDLTTNQEIGSQGYVSDGEVAIRDLAVIPSAQFSAELYPGLEGVQNLAVTVTRTGGTAGAATINYATRNGAAIAGQDYLTAFGTLTFNVGEATKVINLTLSNDGISEDDEDFQIFLFAPAGGGLGLGEPSVATVRISANDFTDVQAPVITHFGLTGPSRGITGAVVQFNEDMDAASAGNVGNYQLTGFDADGNKTKIALASAVYDPARRNVTLTAGAPFEQPGFQRLNFKAKANTDAGLKDTAGNLLDGDEDGFAGGNAVLKYKVVSGEKIVVKDADGDRATLQLIGGGHLDALVPILTDSVNRKARALTQSQFWILDPIALQTTIMGTVKTKPKSDGLVVISEIIGLDKKELTDFFRNPAFRVNTLTFSSNATGL
jgi:hypothetical protein